MLDVLLSLAFISTLAVTVLARQPTGPEGPIGVWLLLLIPCLFVATLVFVMVAKGSLNIVPGGRLIQFVIAIGILITFSIAVFGLLVRDQGVVEVLLIAAPFLILAGCASLIHHSDLPNPRLVNWVAATLLGGAALVGWGLAGYGIFRYVQKDLERSALAEQKAREQEEQYEQRDVAEYANLDDSAPLQALLRFTWSRNEQVRSRARPRVSNLPQLDDRLIELLDQGSEDAISYVANVYEHPPAGLAPAWGRMLERELKTWNSLQYDEHAGTWENNLRGFFVGAQKIQNAGGSLRPELAAWHQHLQKCKGLGNLAAFVERLL